MGSHAAIAQSTMALRVFREAPSRMAVTSHDAGVEGGERIDIGCLGQIAKSIRDAS
jgi:hypothetical protein